MFGAQARRRSGRPRRGAPSFFPRVFAGLGLALLGLSLAPPARAWNAHGHMLIALVAYDALPETSRARLDRLLESHPRYHDDLAAAVSTSLDSPSERARWLFAHAATWPDLVRERPEYHHGTWHYVNLPLALRHSELVSCRDARRDFPASVRRIAALDAERRARGQPGTPQGDSIAVALPENQRILSDPSAPAAARALALAWVLHLVGDAHQPLHGVALFSRERFVTGDRGGNDISVRGRASLHRAWDELLGEGTELAALDAELASLRRDRYAGRVAAARARDLRVDAWLDEDCDLARRAVYVPAILTAVGRFERAKRGAPRASAAGALPSAGEPAVDKPEVSLGDAYFRHAREKARDRAMVAGLRLAALLGKVPF